MRFRLTAHKAPYAGSWITVAESDSINSLDFSRGTHKCYYWNLWVTCDDGKEVMAARIDWSPSAAYLVYNEYSGDNICVYDHWRIIPIVRAVINYNEMFNYYKNSTLVNRICVVQPLDS